MDRVEQVKKIIQDKLKNLKELGSEYSNDKITTLAFNLASTNKTIEEITVLIDNKFSNQIRKVSHNNHLASLKEYYISSIDKLKKGNNCYLLSYELGVKILEQAELTDIKDLNPFLKLVSINKKKQGYKKDNSINNDYELIMSDIAFLLNIEYAKTYRIFDEQMNPIGILNESMSTKKERFLNLEETLKFIKEESTKFTLKNEVIEFHDQSIKFGIKDITDKKVIKNNIEYVLKIFKSLPDITKENYEQLKKSYLNLKLFELLTNSINNNLNNVGIIINKESLKYTYRLSPSYNKYTIELPHMDETKTICNFIICTKKDLLHTLVSNYYNETKEMLSLITDNKDTLLGLIDQVVKEHLEYEEYNKYHRLITTNMDLFVAEVKAKITVSPDTAEDKALYKANNEAYEYRIAPFMDNYVVEDVNANERGSTVLLAIVTIVLFVTIAVILAAIYAVSKMQM